MCESKMQPEGAQGPDCGTYTPRQGQLPAPDQPFATFHDPSVSLSLPLSLSLCVPVSLWGSVALRFLSRIILMD